MGPVQARQFRGLIGFAFRRHPKLNLEEERLTAIERHVQRRVRQLLDLTPTRGRRKNAPGRSGNKKKAEQGKFDILLVFMFDRLGRKSDETPFVVEWFVKKGIRVWSVNKHQRTIIALRQCVLRPLWRQAYPNYQRHSPEKC